LVREEVRAARGEHDVHDPAKAALVDGGCCARDVVTGKARECGLEARLGTALDLGVGNPLRVDELVHGADDLLRLVSGDAGEVDGDAVVVRTRAPDLGLAHTQGVDALGDDADRPLLHGGPRLAWREVRQLVVDVGPTGEVQALVEVELPAAEVGRQPRSVAGQRIVVGDPVDVAGPVHEQREEEDAHDEQPNRPAED